MRRFRPQLIVCNDAEGGSPETLAGAPHWVKVLYSDSMDVEVILDGRARTVRDTGRDGFRRVIEERGDIISGGTTEYPRASSETSFGLCSLFFGVPG